MGLVLLGDKVTVYSELSGRADVEVMRMGELFAGNLNQHRVLSKGDVKGDLIDGEHQTRLGRVLPWRGQCVYRPWSGKQSGIGVSR